MIQKKDIRMTHKQLHKEIDDEIGFLGRNMPHLIAYALIACFLIIIFQRLNILEKRDTMTEPASENFKDYHEECYNSSIVEKYSLVDPSKDDCAKVCGMKMECKQIAGSKNMKCLVTGEFDCYDECTNTTKPYLKFYNETICNKWVLVR